MISYSTEVVFVFLIQRPSVCVPALFGSADIYLLWTGKIGRNAGTFSPQSRNFSFFDCYLVYFF